MCLWRLAPRRLHCSTASRQFDNVSVCGHSVAVHGCGHCAGVYVTSSTYAAPTSSARTSYRPCAHSSRGIRITVAATRRSADEAEHSNSKTGAESGQSGEQWRWASTAAAAVHLVAARTAQAIAACRVHPLLLPSPFLLLAASCSPLSLLSESVFSLLLAAVDGLR